MDLQRRRQVLTIPILLILSGGVIGFLHAGPAGRNLVRQDLRVLAIRDQASDHYLYNPPPEQILEEGSTLIVLGPTQSVQQFRTMT